MSINDISTYLEGGESCGGVRQEDASNLLWCDHCSIALCFDCDTNLHNSKNLNHGHLRVLLPASQTESVRKCEHGSGGSGNVRLDLINKPLLTKSKSKSKSRSSSSKNKRERSSSTTSKLESGRRSHSSRNDLPEDSCSNKISDVGYASVKESQKPDLSSHEPLPCYKKTPSSSLKLLRSALRGGYEEAGLGSRPKLHVTWHPDVTDPICSIVSHTVGHKRVPAFLSRRSQQKQMRQKSKASSKSQARGRKQGTKLKNSEPVYTRSDLSCDSMRNSCTEDEMNEILSTSAYEESTNLEWSNCTYCTEGQSLFDCVNIPEGWNGGLEPESVLLDSDKHEEIPSNETVHEQCMAKVVDRKATTDGCFSERLPEDYCHLLATMLHAASSLGQERTARESAKYEAVSGLFRDMEIRASSANLSASEVAFNPPTQSKISAWISVV
ncbi:uncharacterized protein [Physcomitrium patens]|uniref:Uncharacterized protein n=1 Tax=Physcomitrium patens TaxID=3218 RepID=A0A2K1L1D0_PHYPA|nr:uncharacterized protein LOC112279020 [Physcomitrium patens]PNR59832.1 hypothetical protein PHYPA_002624 [Physcomitrium patens]|eukprot:XP_024368820.1 uncharacterized protein LOC112279020 [Physcomitrella patens]